jgi:hypothetical protein
MVCGSRREARSKFLANPARHLCPCLRTSLASAPPLSYEDALYSASFLSLATAEAAFS